MGIIGTVIGVVVIALVVIWVYKSVHLIGPTEVGLVNKRFAFRKLPADNPIAFHHEAGFQAELLMPGLRIKLWPIFAVQKHPWVQVPAGEIGVVIAQVGAELPIGAKSGVYQQRLRQLLEPWPVHRARRPEGRPASGAPAGHVDAGAPRRVPGADPASGLRAPRLARSRRGNEGVGRGAQPGVVRARLPSSCASS